MTEKIETDFDNGPPRYIEIYNGRDKLGAVAVARSIRAVDPDGNELGVFPTVEQARTAVVRAAFAGKAVP